MKSLCGRPHAHARYGSPLDTNWHRVIVGANGAKQHGFSIAFYRSEVTRVPLASAAVLRIRFSPRRETMWRPSAQRDTGVGGPWGRLPRSGGKGEGATPLGRRKRSGRSRRAKQGCKRLRVGCACKGSIDKQRQCRRWLFKRVAALWFAGLCSQAKGDVERAHIVRGVWGTHDP